MRLCGGGGGVSRGEMMTEDVNKERLVSDAAAGFFGVCLCHPEEKATGGELRSDFFEIPLWQINTCIIDQAERGTLSHPG